MRKLCREAKAEGFKYLKMKVGKDLEDDMRRASIIREEIGDDLKLMMDANQKWDVGEAIKNMQSLKNSTPGGLKNLLVQMMYWVMPPLQKP